MKKRPGVVHLKKNSLAQYRILELKLELILSLLGFFSAIKSYFCFIATFRFGPKKNSHTRPNKVFLKKMPKNSLQTCAIVGNYDKLDFVLILFLVS